MLKYLAILGLVGAIGVSSAGDFKIIHAGGKGGTARAAVRSLVDPRSDPPAPSPSPPDPLPPPSPPAPLPDPTPPDPPSLTLPATVEGNAGEFLKVTANTNGDHVRWVSMDKGLAVFPGEMLKDSTSTVVLSTTGGQYRLLAYTALADVPSDPVICMVVVHGPQPPPPAPIPVPPAPGPAPAPAPIPPPAPIPGPTPVGLWVITVDDVTARTPAIAAVMSDMAFWSSLKQQGASFQKYNITDPAVTGNQTIKQAMAANTSPQYPKGIPLVLLIDSSRTTHNVLNMDSLALPGTTADLKALINRYVGGQLR